MTVFLPGPYLLDFPQVQTGLTHHFAVNCDAIGSPPIGADPADVDMRTKSGTPVDLQTAADDLWDAVRGLYPTTTLCSQFVLWKYNGTNLDKTFISGGTLAAPNGSGVTAVVLSSQLICTYRSGAGHIGKLSFVETVLASSIKAPFGGGAIGETVGIKTYLLGGGNIVMARDRSFPVAALNELAGQNEKIFKRRNRQ
jgi:hypothetical protein